MALNVTRTDIEDIYGKANVQRWSQLDPDSQEADANRITKAINIAQQEVEDRFRASDYNVDFVAKSGTPHTVINWIATLAGVWLYQSRGRRAIDTRGTSLADKMQSDRRVVLAQIDSVLMGARELNAQRDTNGPNSPLVVGLIFIFLLLTSGCTTMTYKDFSYVRFLSDTKIGQANIKIAPDGTVDVSISDLSAEQRLTQTINELTGAAKGLVP